MIIGCRGGGWVDAQCSPNVYKNRILTSTNDASILEGLTHVDPVLAEEFSTTIDEFSVRKDSIDPALIHLVELTTGVRLLGTPVGSPAFALEFFNEQVTEVWVNVLALNNGITDLQTRLRTFT